MFNKTNNVFHLINKKLAKDLNDKKKLLTETYFEINKILNEKFNNVILMMEIGSFFEIYEQNGEGKAKEISSLLNIQLTKKNKSINEISIKNPLMTGFPNHALDKYLPVLINENRYTIAIIRQEGKPPEIKRYLEKIITPGVNPEEYTNETENYIMGIYIKQNSDLTFETAFSAIDINTGEVKTGVYTSSFDDKESAVDSLYGILTGYSFKEILILYENVPSDKINKFINNFDLNEKNIIMEEKNFYDKNYIKTLIEYVYKNEKSLISTDKIIGMEDEKIKIIFSSVIEYIISHFPEDKYKKILSILKEPVLINDLNFVYLGNNPIKQLEIDKVLKLIDKTKTSMGRRLIKDRLFNPIHNISEIESRYKKIEFMRKNSNYLKFQKHLNNIYDIEKINKRIKSELIHPFEIVFLYNSLIEIKNILEVLKKKTEIIFIQDFIKYLEKHFIIENLNVKQEEFKENYINPESDEEIKELVKKQNEIHSLIEELKNKIELLNPNIKIDVNFLEKEGYTVSLTKNRWKLIEKDFKEFYYTPFKNSIYNNKIEFKNFKIKKLTSNIKILGGFLEDISAEKFKLSFQLEKAVKKKFIEIIRNISKKYSDKIEEIINLIAEIDVAVSGAEFSLKYNYTKPVLIDKNSKDLNKRNSLYKETYIKDLRHPLIESNQENGIYVPNDINFNEYQGMLLYGINSAGKSSLMKSLGIAVFLAQAGFYVPATKMYLKPYKKIFTRIESHDNLSKGLSTFAVEMLELKNILNRCDKNSLILGDEIAHGTETFSAISIVASAIYEIYKKGSFFIFATHLHQLTDIEEIKNLPKLGIKHLEVYFDGQKLVYDRKLKNGSGSSIYGLEFAKSIYMNKEFLNRAEKIRKEIIKKR